MKENETPAMPWARASRQNGASGRSRAASSDAISPTRIAGVQKSEGGVTPVAGEAQELGIRPVLKAPVRRMVREGCETALSSLVGPEARRMTPGRCIS